MRRPRQSGMTLIEVMIATLLFGILSAGILMALRVGMNAMNRADDRLMANRRSAYAARILQSELTGFMPVETSFQANPQSALAPMPFFEGEPSSMRFVSTYSLQGASRGNPQILEFQVIAGEREGVRLVVNERPYTGPASAGALTLGYAFDPATATRIPLFQPIITGPGSFVLADRLALCHFLYEYGPRGTIPGGWTNHWVFTEWPLAIRIEMAPFTVEPNRLQPMTITEAVHVTMREGIEYADN